jgi:hypothetical protein
VSNFKLRLNRSRSEAREDGARGFKRGLNAFQYLSVRGWFHRRYESVQLLFLSNAVTEN